MNKLTALIEEMKYDSSGYAKIILELCALLEKAEEALEQVGGVVDGYYVKPGHCTVDFVEEALAAIKQWKESTSPEQMPPTSST